MMDTDYEHYAVVYTQKKDSQEPSIMLQLYSGCPSRGGGRAGTPIATQGHCVSTQHASTFPCPESFLERTKHDIGDIPSYQQPHFAPF